MHHKVSFRKHGQQRMVAQTPRTPRIVTLQRAFLLVSVAFIQSPIGAEKVSVWNERAGLPRPLRALWLDNTTGLTLDGGAFNVIEENTFAGEGIFDPMRPGEKRLVSYASDLALNVNAKQSSDRQRITRVVIDKGVMKHMSELREKKTYTFRNEDSTPRTVIVEHPARPGYELRSDAKPTESTAAWMRFRLSVAPKQTSDLIVEEAAPRNQLRPHQRYRRPDRSFPPPALHR
jgi:hypothetical protein